MSKAYIAFEIMGIGSIANPLAITIFKRTECLFMSFSKIDNMARVSMFQREHTAIVFDSDFEIDKSIAKFQRHREIHRALTTIRTTTKKSATKSSLLSFLNGSEEQH